jgi:hypothetical protein
MNDFEQFLRIALYNGGAYFLGAGTMQSDIAQQAIGGAVSVIAFAWFLYRNRQAKQ